MGLMSDPMAAPFICFIIFILEQEVGVPQTELQWADDTVYGYGYSSGKFLILFQLFFDHSDGMI